MIAKVGHQRHNETGESRFCILGSVTTEILIESLVPHFPFVCHWTQVIMNILEVEDLKIESGSC